jgi:hypothetical protein
MPAVTMPDRLAAVSRDAVVQDWASEAHTFPRLAVVLAALGILAALGVAAVVATRAVARRSATVAAESGPRPSGTEVVATPGLPASGSPASGAPTLDTPPPGVPDDTLKTTETQAETDGIAEVVVEEGGATVGSLPVRTPGLQLLGPYGFGRDHQGRARTKPDTVFGTPGLTHLTPRRLPSGTPATNRDNNASRSVDIATTTPPSAAEPGVVPSDEPGGIRSSN